MAVTGEHLRAGHLPDGARLTSGSEDDPSSSLEYSLPDNPTGTPRFGLFRHLTRQPARELISADRTEPVTIHGRAGVLGRSDTPGGQRLLVAWNERDDVVVSITATDTDRSTVLQVADGTRYDPGRPGPTGPAADSGAPPHCRRLPPGAKTRDDMVRTVEPAAGVTVQAKLVRRTDLETAAPTLANCTIIPCPEGLVLWLLLRTGPPGTFPHSCPAGASPEACTGSWSITIHDADTGRTRSNSIGNGPAPPYWDGLGDLAP